MRKRFWWTMLAVLVFTIGGLSISRVSAVSSNVVIYQVQAGALSSESAAATKEFISIYNNSAQEIDVSDWCLTNKSNISFACMTPTAGNITLHLPSHAFATFSSDSFANAHAYTPDSMYPTTNSSSGSIVAGSDTISLIDNNGLVIDSMSWTTSLTGGSLLQRKLVVGSLEQYVDTDITAADFQKLTSLVAPLSGLDEVLTLVDLCKNIDGIQESLPAEYVINLSGDCMLPIDACTNIDGLQTEIPAGYGIDMTGLCIVDVCANIVGLQQELPVDKDLDGNANCIDHDVCSNLSGVQAHVPAGYFLSGVYTCLLDVLVLHISELLPNAVGDDDGHEYVEIYNPNAIAVSLLPYRLVVGTTTPKSYVFPVGAAIAANSYMVFFDDDMSFTLVNSSSQVRLTTSDDQSVDDAPVYSEPRDGQTWADIAGTWQYTNQPTPGLANLASIEESVDPDGTEEVVVGLKPCAPNQYRNPETNRCRLLVTVGSTLSPCKDGQYRSEETNRCRSIAADSTGLSACAVNQYRSPETNRCRLTTTDDNGLAPCGVGQERNPDTNRCRNISGSVPAASFAVEPITDTASGFASWWALGGISLIALAYAVWEWRSEIINFMRKIGSFSHSGK